MLEELKQTVYLSVNQKGNMERYMGPDEPAKEYRRIGGFLDGLRSQTRKINDKDITFLYIYLADGQESISLSVPMYMGVGSDILRCLTYAMEKGFDVVSGQRIFIETYRKVKEDKSFSNATVYWGLTKLDWAALPNGISREEGLVEMMKTVNEYVASKKGSAAPGGPAGGSFHSVMNDVGDLPEDGAQYEGSPFDKE